MDGELSQVEVETHEPLLEDDDEPEDCIVCGDSISVDETCYVIPIIRDVAGETATPETTPERIYNLGNICEKCFKDVIVTVHLENRDELVTITLCEEQRRGLMNAQ